MMSVKNLIRKPEGF